MKMPTDLTRAMIVCPPFWTFDLYFWDDTRGHVVRHYEGDISRPELGMLEDDIWASFGLDRWIKPAAESR